MSDDVRRYTLSIEVEVKSQNDYAHFQPDSVAASAPQLGIEWVSGNDVEALREFFDFFVNLPVPSSMSIMEYGESPLLATRQGGHQRHHQACHRTVVPIMGISRSTGESNDTVQG